MKKLPILKAKEVCGALIAFSFVLVRQRGSHMQFRHIDGRAKTVPNHPSRDLSPIILRQILKDINMSGDDFLTKL